jgi:hypothetical protein
MASLLSEFTAGRVLIHTGSEDDKVLIPRFQGSVAGRSDHSATIPRASSLISASPTHFWVCNPETTLPGLVTKGNESRSLIQDRE